MLDEKALANALEIALEEGRSSGADVEATLVVDEEALTRYANSAIHQNMKLQNAVLTVRVVLGQRAGVASTNRLERDDIARAVEDARRIAENQEPNPDFRGLPSPEELPEPRPQSANPELIARTRHATPAQRADAVGEVISRTRAQGLSVAGAFATRYTWVGVASSKGVRARAESSVAELRCVATGPASTGYADHCSYDVDGVDAGGVADRAARAAILSANPRAVEPGEWEVILSPMAVAELVGMMGYIGFGALAYQEGRSFVSGKLGEQLFDPRFNLWDDGNDPAGLPMLIDFEGAGRQKVTLVSSGIANAIVYDFQTAGKSGERSTGHALAQPSTRGPMPLSLFVGTGDAGEEDLIASTRRGLYVTRLWYTRVVHPVRSTLTGMTRDGTLLIEDGQVVGGVKNLRYTDELTRVFGTIDQISSSSRLERVFYGAGSARVPAIKLPSFRFTSGTDF